MRKLIILCALLSGCAAVTEEQFAKHDAIIEAVVGYLNELQRQELLPTGPELVESRKQK